MTVLDLKPVRLGSALRRWRLLNRIKQTHAAELFGVAQSTISRWESGAQEMEPAERAQVERRLSARLDAAADRALARLVDAGPSPMHLVCDLSHALLACSPSRAAEFGVPLSGLMGRSLWRYATRKSSAWRRRWKPRAGARPARHRVRHRRQWFGRGADPPGRLSLDAHPAGGWLGGAAGRDALTRRVQSSRRAASLRCSRASPSRQAVGMAAQ